MAGLPSRYAKMGFKKGWKAYHSAHLSGSRKKSKSKSKKHHRSYLLGGDMSSPALLQRPVRNLSKITPEKIFSPIIDLGLLIAGMIVGANIKKAAPIKNPHLMNTAQTVIGIGGSLLTKNRFVKMPLIGIALQGTIAEAKMLMPKMIPLAGDDEVIYLPAGEEYAPQLEYAGEGEYVIEGESDDRMGAVIDGEEYMEGDERVGAVIDGEYEVEGDDPDDMGGEEGSDI